MRAWLLEDTEGPGSYRLGETSAPEPGAEEVRVALKASGINHLDLWVSKGLPAPKSFPHIAGGDGAGRIDALGPGVGGWKVGDEVVVNPSIGCGHCPACLRGEAPYCPEYGIVGEHRPGTLADLVVVPARNLVPRPESLPWDEAGAYGLAYGTAYRMLRRAGLRAGERLLIVGVGGGVGAAGLVLGRARGARVVVTSRDRGKLDRAGQLGAEAGFDSSSEFSREVRTAIGGADVVLDNVGPATFDQSIRSLVPGGRLMISGGTSGTQVGISLPYLFFKQLHIIGSTMFTYEEFAEVSAMVGAGKVPVIVDTVFGFEDLPKALAKMEAGEQFGKLVLRH